MRRAVPLGDVNIWNGDLCCRKREKKIGKPRLEIEDIKHVFSIDLGGFIAADDEI